MSTTPTRRVLSHGWLYLPAVSSPVGGGLVKLGHGSTWAAVSVGVAPYAVCALLYVVFVIGYLAAVLRFLCAGTEGQQAMARLIDVSADAVVSILTLSRRGPRR
jgi:hypothetical protein